MALCQGKTTAIAMSLSSRGFVRCLIGRRCDMGTRQLSYAVTERLPTRPESTVVFQQCRTAALAGNRDYRKAKIDFSWQKQGRAHPHVNLILMKDDPEFGLKYREVRVKRRLARAMILHQEAEYANHVTRAKYGHLKPKESTASADWANTWFLENFRLPALIPHSDPFALYATDIQAALRQSGVHLPLHHIYLEKPLTSYGDHRIPVMVPNTRGDDFEQVTILANVMRESDALVVYRVRQGVDTADVAEDEEFELVGDIVTQYKTLRSSRIRVKGQIEDEKVTRINELRKKKGLPPLPLPSERLSMEQSQQQPAQEVQDGEKSEDKALATVQ